MGNEGRISGATNLGDLVGSLLKVFFWLRYSKNRVWGLLGRTLLEFCHSCNWVSLVCHPTNEICLIAIMKHGYHAKMHFLNFL